MLSHRFTTAINWLVSGQGRIAAYAVLVMALMVTIDVILRFVFNAPTKFATEFAAYLLVVSVSFGLAYTLRERAHIRIDFITSRLPRRVRSWVQVITSIMALVFTGLLSWLNWGEFMTSLKLQTTSRTAMDVVIWPAQLFMPLGLLVISLLLILNIYSETKVALGKVEKTDQEEGKTEL